jgi:predicted small metal-binding protein
MEQMKQKMENMKQISCDPECGFMIRSHDETEVLGVAKKHIKEKHKMEATMDMLKSRMKAVA